jgi:hypothetical protein
MIGVAAITLPCRDIDNIDAILGALPACACAVWIQGEKLAPINTAVEIAGARKRFISFCLSLS